MLAHLLVALLLALSLRATTLRRQHVLSFLLQIAFFSAYAALLLPFCYASNDFSGTDRHTIFYANVYRDNLTPERVAAEIEHSQADIVALTEYYAALDPILKLDAKYPYSVRQVREDYFGMVLYSRFPIAPNPIVSLGGNLPPVIIASINTNPTEVLTLALAHTQPPVSDQAIYNNTLIMRRLAQRMRHAEEPVIALGDFNATPFSWFYLGFKSIANLRDASFGFGLRKTWNSQHWWLWFIIDHIFVNNRIEVQQVERLGDVGSDHFPLLMRFGVS